jgi:hypothetical protein
VSDPDDIADRLARHDAMLEQLQAFVAQQMVMNAHFEARSYWIPGSFETSSSMSEPNNALPRFRTL